MVEGNYTQRKKGEKMNNVLHTPNAIVDWLRIAISDKMVLYIV